jgi:hypothetical protein
MPFEWLPTLVSMLESAPEVSLAVHSSWRDVHSMEYLRDFLEPLSARVMGAVPSGTKSQAILEFLAAHPEVKDYLILDDSPEEFELEQRARLLACAPLSGISDSAIQARLQAWLAD